VNSTVFKPHLFGMLAGLFLASGLVASSLFATGAWLKIRNTQFITVKGSARKNIESDLVIWRGSFSVEASTLLEAQRKLRDDRGRVEQYLESKGVTNAAFTPIHISELQATTRDAGGLVTQQSTVGYRLTQSLQIESADVTRIVNLDRESAELVEAGVLFMPQSPEFIYTRASEAKVEMLAEATKDARERARQISEQGNRVVDGLHSADMGVFQITPLHGVTTSWEGMNDTSSRQKTITAVVTATFALK
jgi:uncharacterized protein